MRTLAICCQKGGTGKTTVALAIAVAAARGGLSVLVADLDPQQSISMVGRLRQGSNPSFQTSTAAKLFSLSSTAARAAVDLLIVDTPGAGDERALEAMRLSDLTLVVARPGYLDIVAAAFTAEATRRLRRSAKAVLNQAASPRTGVEAATVTEATQALAVAGLPLISPPLRLRAVHSRAIGRGLAADEVEPRGPAAWETGRLWSAVHGTLFGAGSHPHEASGTVPGPRPLPRSGAARG